MTTLFQFLLQYGVIFIFLWMLLTHLGLPLPAIPFMLAVGGMAGLGYMPPVSCLLVVFSAALLGDISLFFITRSRGKHLLGVFCRMTDNPDTCVRKTHLLLLRYGAPLLLVANFIPGVNTMSVPLAGASRMKFTQFVLFDSLGVLFWILIYFALGYYFGEKLEAHIESMLAVIRWIGILFLIPLALFALRKFIQGRKFLRQLALARITPEELKDHLDSGVDIMIIDLRNPREFMEQPRTLPEALSIPFEDWDLNLAELSRGREIILVGACPDKAGRARAVRWFIRRGVTRVRVLDGGIDAWMEKSFPVKEVHLDINSAGTANL